MLKNALKLRGTKWRGSCLSDLLQFQPCLDYICDRIKGNESNIANIDFAYRL